MFVICVIIFVWPVTSLVHPYDLQMLDGKYNPWYTKTHYIDANEIEKWDIVKKGIDDAAETAGVETN